MWFTTMDETICIDDDESSIIEIEVPTKKPPPLIEVEDIDDIILNVEGKQRVVELAEDIIKMDPLLSNNKSKNSRENHQKKIKSKNYDKNNADCDSFRQQSSVNSPSHWTDDMIKFYDDDWGDERNFSVEKIQSKMDKNPALWEISRKDIFYMHNRLKKSHVRCTNCNQHGHRLLNCPEPPYVPKCHMCGMPGHLENSCPNSICLNCGNRTHEFTIFCPACQHETEKLCSRCMMKGHHFINCTDNWRLFHLTTNQGNITEPKKYMYKNAKDVWCCNCGRKGHYQIFCNHKKDLAAFMDTYPFVASYENAFNDPQTHTVSHNRQRSKNSHSKNSQLKNLWYNNNKNQTVFKNLNNVSKTKKKNKKRENLLKFNPLNNVLSKEPVKKKKKHKKSKKKSKARQEKTSNSKQESKIFFPLGL